MAGHTHRGGPPADIEFVGNFHMPAEGDFGMAGAPADSESTIPAAGEEMQAMPYPRAMGNPTGIVDGDLLRRNPRDA
eukprot:8164322-Pyramimonas_sp.AAC.1